MQRAGGGRRGLWARAQRPFPPVSGGRRAGGANFAANLGLGSGAARARTAETDGAAPGRVWWAQGTPGRGRRGTGTLGDRAWGLDPGGRRGGEEERPR